MRTALFVMLHVGIISGLYAAPNCKVIGVIGNTSSTGYAVASRADLTKAIAVNAPQIILTQDVDMTNSKEFLIHNKSNININGNGFKFYRTSDWRGVNMFTIKKVSNLTLENVGFDDTKDGGNVPVETTPATRMILIDQSSNIVFNQTVIENGKGYMVYVRQTSGFTFTNSVMRYAGVLGMYIGHDNEKSSNRILIEHNHFYENATNALAIQGVTGQKKNIIRENLFERNHIYGRFAVAPKYGTGMTGGGQLYIANVDNMLVIGNTIDDGYCLNCYRSNRPDGQFKDITGIEISGNYGNQIRVTNLTITENIITNNDAWGIGQNVNSTIDGTTKIFNNTVNGNGKQFRFQVGFSGS